MRIIMVGATFPLKPIQVQQPVQNVTTQYGRRRHVEFTSGLHFDILSGLGIQNASAYQVSSKSVNILRSYDVLYIFMMASVRHLEF